MVNNIRKLVLLVIAGVSTLTGIVGIFVPLLPTTCFIILAAWCLAKSDPAYLRWMYAHPKLGHLFRHISPRFMPRDVQPSA